MTKCMSYREVEIDSPFSQRNKRAYCVSTLRSSNRPDATRIPFFYIFYKKLFMGSLEASREALSLNTEKASS